LSQFGNVEAPSRRSRHVGIPCHLLIAPSLSRVVAGSQNHTRTLALPLHAPSNRGICISIRGSAACKDGSGFRALFEFFPVPKGHCVLPGLESHARGAHEWNGDG